MAMAIHLSTDYDCFHTQLSWVIVTENIWPTKPEKLSSVPLWKKFLDPGPESITQAEQG